MHQQAADERTTPEKAAAAKLALGSITLTAEIEGSSRRARGGTAGRGNGGGTETGVGIKKRIGAVGGAESTGMEIETDIGRRGTVKTEVGIGIGAKSGMGNKIDTTAAAAAAGAVRRGGTKGQRAVAEIDQAVNSVGAAVDVIGMLPHRYGDQPKRIGK